MIIHSLIIAQELRADPLRINSERHILESYVIQPDGTALVTGTRSQIEVLHGGAPKGSPSANVLHYESWDTDKPFYVVHLQGVGMLHRNAGWPDLSEAEYLASQATEIPV